MTAANPAEWLALRTGLVPAAAAEAWGGMATSGVLVAAVRTGITARLAEGQATAATVAADLALDPLPTRLLLDCLRSAGHVTERAGRYRLSRSGRRWLDPAAPLSVAGYVAGTADYWPWWQGLEQATRTGTSSGSHTAPPADPYWRAMFAAMLLPPTWRMWKLIWSIGEMIRKIAIVSPRARPSPSMLPPMIPPLPNGMTTARIMPHRVERSAHQRNGASSTTRS